MKSTTVLNHNLLLVTNPKVVLSKSKAIVDCQGKIKIKKNVKRTNFLQRIHFRTESR